MSLLLLKLISVKWDICTVNLEISRKLFDFLFLDVGDILRFGFWSFWSRSLWAVVNKDVGGLFLFLCRHFRTRQLSVSYACFLIDLWGSRDIIFRFFSISGFSSICYVKEHFSFYYFSLCCYKCSWSDIVKKNPFSIWWAWKRNLKFLLFLRRKWHSFRSFDTLLGTWRQFREFFDTHLINRY